MPAGKSHKGAPAAAPASGGDRIGSLPDEILHRVLSFLPAQQAVQTCVLARRWIHLWKYATGLRIVGADGNAPVPFEEVREFVDSLLLLRGSSPLERFEVKVAGAAIDVRNLRLWVRYGMMCNVQVLRLKVHGNAPALLRFEDPPLASRYLTKLELRGLAFNKDFLDFSRCPAIQDLIIKECSFKHAERILSQSLKHINIVRGIFNNLSSRTPIHTPNLASLKLHVSGGRTPILDRMPLMVSADVLISSCDSCSRSDNGDCGDESCKGCIPNDTSSVLLHGISEAEKLLLASGSKTVYLQLKRSYSCSPYFKHHAYLKDLLIYMAATCPVYFQEGLEMLPYF
ncbi:hypothetical protein HU200_016719 [Digitaria exilis]|uniref:F-box domain-containing protein n=1 Tax=Digitaria exilis TaxID=1010633 RepID=A0A835KI41_9POAL|nr:hypothetical protein HU200_016719 [Digitaria exilis]